MNTTLIRAVIVVTFALVFYSVAVITEQKLRRVTRLVLAFLTAGLVLDISATTLMIIGARKIPVTVHGFIGYSALILMLIDTILIWRSKHKHGDEKVSRKLNLFTRFAYLWWVIAYVAGAVIAMTLQS